MNSILNKDAPNARKPRFIKESLLKLKALTVCSSHNNSERSQYPTLINGQYMVSENKQR